MRVRVCVALSFFIVALQPKEGHGLILEVSRSHTTTIVGRTPLDERSACLRDLHLLTHNTLNRQHTMYLSPAGVEPTISAGERQQTYALDRTATEIGCLTEYIHHKFDKCFQNTIILFLEKVKATILNELLTS